MSRVEHNTVTRHSKITLNFSLALSANEQIIDSNFDQPAVTFEYGDGSLLPAFEEALLGLQQGQEAEFNIPAARAFGEPREDNIHRIPIDQFKEFKLEPGLMIDFSGANQQGNTGVVIDFNTAYATLDFNHPLAGQEIKFRVKIEHIEQLDKIHIQAIDVQPEN